ncbi:MAG: cation:proton antiporter regulatory subunit [Phototrophicaceae bacterium]
MTKLQILETTLPGVGVRHEFSTDNSDRIGVITHHSGQRDVLVYDKDDPDICRLSLRLTEQESNQLGQFLGSSKVTQTFTNLAQEISGLSIDWIPIRNDWDCAGHTIDELGLHKTGVNIVAVIRNGQTIAAPNSDFQLWSGDMAVVIGSPQGIQQTYDVMHG